MFAHVRWHPLGIEVAPLPILPLDADTRFPLRPDCLYIWQVAHVTQNPVRSWFRGVFFWFFARAGSSRPLPGGGTPERAVEPFTSQLATPESPQPCIRLLRG